MQSIFRERAFSMMKTSIDGYAKPRLESPVD